MPDGLYIPPDALRVFLESFEGPLDLLLYLIRRQKFDIMQIPMAVVTEQYMSYVELIRDSNLELAADYLVMAAHLMQIKSQLLLPVTHADTGEEVVDPQAELARRLLEYEKMKAAAVELDRIPRSGRDFLRAYVLIEQTQSVLLPQVEPLDLKTAWEGILKEASLKGHHKVSRQELSVREFMSGILRRLQSVRFAEFAELFETDAGRDVSIVSYLALLELAKEGLVRITQAAPFAPIYVSASSSLSVKRPEGRRRERPPEKGDGPGGADRADQHAGRHIRGPVHEKVHPRPGDENGKRKGRGAPARVKAGQGKRGGKGSRGVPRGKGAVGRAGVDELARVHFAGTQTVQERLERSVAQHKTREKRHSDRTADMPERLEKEQKDAERDPHEATVAQTGDGLPEGQRLGAAQKAAHGVQKFNFAHGYALGPKRCACAWYGRGHGSDLARGFRYNWGEIFS